MTSSSHPTHVVVRRKYASIAAKGGSCCGPTSSCCGGGAEDVARGLGYTEAELATLPEEANLGLSCGHPTALAGLRPGEVVLDLGSGAGLDVFLAAQRVGPSGRAIGVDMTPEMLEKARHNTEVFQERTGLANVEFREGQIEAIPLPDASVDVVLSNCVINLSPDQGRVWKEIARVLRPGGRVSISDMVLLKPLPDALRQDLEALVGCIAGAPLLEDLRGYIQAAGLVDVSLTPKEGAVDAMLHSEATATRQILARLPEGTLPGDLVASLFISARKAKAAGVRVQVFDPAQCCPTGVCGPSVDPKLVRFAADLEWLKGEGIAVERFNLSQQALVFATDETVKAALQEKGEAALPLIKVNGQAVSTGSYPTREQLAAWTGMGALPPSIYTEAVQELVAIGAAIASNCEPCFKFHYDKARKLGVSKEDMLRAVKTAQGVKESPAKAVLGLAERYLSRPAMEPLAIPESKLLPIAPEPGCAGGTGESSDCCG